MSGHAETLIQITLAYADGEVAAIEKLSTESNPYPKQTLLHGVWLAGYNSKLAGQ